MRKQQTTPEDMMFLMPRMRNLWIAPHLGEMIGCLESLAHRGFAGDAIHRNSKWQIPRLNLELWRIGEGQKNLREAVRQISQQNFEHVQLIGIAGALDPKLSQGEVVTQTADQLAFALVDRPITTAADRNELAQTTGRQIVVMESFWSDPVFHRELSRDIFFETRVISDHGENLVLKDIQKNLGAWMDSVVAVTLPQIPSF